MDENRYAQMLPKTGSARRNLVSWTLFFLVGLGMVILTWGKWADITIDFGRELYVPWRLAAGEILYRDIAYFNGPFSPYLNSLLFRIFGVGLRTIIFVNFFWIFLVLLLVYKVFTRLEGEFAGLLACLSFLLVFAFGRIAQVGNYNFVTPYSHELLHGMVLIMLELWFLGRSEDPGRNFYLPVAGLLMGFCFLTKPEVFAAAVAAMVAAWAMLWWKGKLPGVRISSMVVLAATLPVLGAWVLLYPVMGGTGAIDALLFPFRAATGHHLWSLAFYQRIMGTDKMGYSVSHMFAMAVFWALILGVPVLLSAKCPRVLKGRLGSISLAVSIIAIVIAGLRYFGDLMRPLPLALLGVGVVWFRRSDVLGTAVLAAASVFLIKMLLNVHFYHYGFALAMLAALGVFAASMGSVPEVLTRNAVGAEAFRRTALVMLVALVSLHVGASYATFSGIRFSVGHGVDRFQSDKRGPAVEAALDDLARLTRPDWTLAVLPEGAMLNYLARLKNPTPYINFMPPEVILFGEKSMLKAFMDNPPDLIALIDKDTTEYSFPVFGKDYGRELMKWVLDNHQEFAVFGQRPLTGRGFGVTLLEHRHVSHISSSE